MLEQARKIRLPLHYLFFFKMEQIINPIYFQSDLMTCFPKIGLISSLQVKCYLNHTWYVMLLSFWSAFLLSVLNQEHSNHNSQTE